jgi:hypothetical protein
MPPPEWSFANTTVVKNGKRDRPPQLAESRSDLAIQKLFLPEGQTRAFVALS